MNAGAIFEMAASAGDAGLWLGRSQEFVVWMSDASLKVGMSRRHFGCLDCPKWCNEMKSSGGMNRQRKDEGY